MIEAVMSLPLFADLLIVDDNSPDGTALLVKEAQQDYPNRIHLISRSGKLGLGTAYINGFKFALSHGYDYVFEMDCDFSHNPADIQRLYDECELNGSDMAVGSRYKSGVNVVNWPMGRVLMSYFASRYVRFITRMPVNDTTAGFVCYKADVLRAMDLDNIRFKGYAFQIEMKFTAYQLGYKVSEVPIVFTNRVLGTSKMNSGIFGEAFLGVISMKLRSLFKKPRRKSENADI
ncbi:MAG: polyprenol monophosphomannose synthase [Bacteroidales bacterium]|nr:polyprenol monophosphomannose synthase [Bacteroidales bacterium]